MPINFDNHDQIQKEEKVKRLIKNKRIVYEKRRNKKFMHNYLKKLFRKKAVKIEANNELNVKIEANNELNELAIKNGIKKLIDNQFVFEVIRTDLMDRFVNIFENKYSINNFYQTYNKLGLNLDSLYFYFL